MEGRTPAYYTSAAKATVYRSSQLDINNDWVRWDTGYRLPTDAEWEKAARGGVNGRRFSWADTDTIQHSRANYRSPVDISYDTSPTRGYHPDYYTEELPQDQLPPGYVFKTGPMTSPVGSFVPNGYGLYDMIGNVHELCWDWSSTTYYETSPGTDPRGPLTPSSVDKLRRARGGAWSFPAKFCRVASLGQAFSPIDATWPRGPALVFGLRAILPAVP
jgi:formylglycine-generating enzyme required for sulfatase activity